MFLLSYPMMLKYLLARASPSTLRDQVHVIAIGNPTARSRGPCTNCKRDLGNQRRGKSHRPFFSYSSSSLFMVYVLLDIDQERERERRHELCKTLRYAKLKLCPDANGRGKKGVLFFCRAIRKTCPQQTSFFHFQMPLIWVEAVR